MLILMIPKDFTTVFDVDNPELVEIQCKILILVIALINLDQTYTLSGTEDDDTKPKETED